MFTVAIKIDCGNLSSGSQGDAVGKHYLDLMVPTRHGHHVSNLVLCGGTSEVTRWPLVRRAVGVACAPVVQADDSERAEATRFGAG
jgi:hypothetical protein